MNEKKILIILLSIPLMLTIATVIFLATPHLFIKGNDLSELKVNNIEKKVEFASERGFGSDRFDIYSFSLPEGEELSDFKNLDDDYYTKYKFRFSSLIGIFDSEMGKKEMNRIQQEVKDLESNADTQYLYFTKNNMSKLYVYSQSINKGYCFILVI